jgi:RNA polymerase sigma factor (sigma-70 family)
LQKRHVLDAVIVAHYYSEATMGKLISEQSKQEHDAAPRPDGRVLQQFAQDGDPEAFAALMERHGPYVLSVCRHLTRHAQDAEDVFQACFLELARKAATIRDSNSVAGWLQTVAVRLSHKSRARTARRHQKETTGAAHEASVEPEDISWREACQILQEEIAQLPEELRLPIILCLFQGQTQEDAARQLALNSRTVKDRLRRGRELLRSRLVRRGVTLAVLGTLLSASNLQAAVPAALAQGTLQSAVALTSKATAAAVVAAPVGVTGASAASWVAVVAAVLGLTVAGSGAFIAWDQRAEPDDVKPPAAKPAPMVQAPPVKAAGEPIKIQRSFRGKQFDAKLFQWAGPNAEKHARFEEEGLRLTLPAEGGPADAVGIKLRPWVRGDVEVEATLEFIHVPQPPAGFGAGVTLYFFMESADRDGFWHGKLIDHTEGPIYSYGQRFRNRPNERTTKFSDFSKTEHEVGFTRLKVVRKGARFDLYAAEGLAGQLQLVHSHEVSAADMSIVRFAADPIWRPNVAIDVRLIDFTITAAELIGHEK